MTFPTKLAYLGEVNLNFSLVQNLPLEVASGSYANFVSAATDDDLFFVAMSAYSTAAPSGNVYNFVSQYNGAFYTGAFYVPFPQSSDGILFCTVANGFVYVVLENYVVLKFSILQFTQNNPAPQIVDLFVCDHYISQSVGSPEGVFISQNHIWLYWQSSVDSNYYAAVFDQNFNLIGSGKIGDAQTFSKFPDYIPGTDTAPFIQSADTSNGAQYARRNGIFWLGQNNSAKYELGYILAAINSEPLECGTTNTSNATPLYQTWGSAAISNYSQFNDFCQSGNLWTPSGATTSWPNTQLVTHANQSISVLLSGGNLWGLNFAGLPNLGGTPAAWLRLDGTLYAIGESGGTPNALSLYSADLFEYTSDPPASVRADILSTFKTARIT